MGVCSISGMKRIPDMHELALADILFLRFCHKSKGFASPAEPAFPGSGKRGETGVFTRFGA